MIGPLNEDIRIEHSMIEGSKLLLKSIENYHFQKKHGFPFRPLKIGNNVRWRCMESVTKKNPESKNSIKSREAMRRVKAMHDEREGLIAANRDPCVKCGVRADIGCKHRPASKPVNVFG